jgi:WD40 repeat-containing protein SMU1
MPQNCKVETACFSPNGQFLVTGTTDGYIEVWDPFSFKHSSDIPYQKDEIFMMQFLASASEDKLIKVWMMAKGTCLRKFSDPNSVNTA